MATNEAFLGAKLAKSFHFEKFNLNSTKVYRNGYPVAGTPVRTDNDRRLYLNSLAAPALGQLVHGVPYNYYANQYILVFDITSTQQASHDYLYPEQIKRSASLSLWFSPQLTNCVKVFLLCGRSSTI